MGEKSISPPLQCPKEFLSGQISSISSLSSNKQLTSHSLGHRYSGSELPECGDHNFPDSRCSINVSSLETLTYFFLTFRHSIKYTCGFSFLSGSSGLTPEQGRTVKGGRSAAWSCSSVNPLNDPLQIFSPVWALASHTVQQRRWDCVEWGQKP